MKKIAVVVLFFFITSLVFSNDNNFDTLIPEEYDKNEFPRPLRTLRRAEVILIGSYPFSVLFAKLGMDAYDFASNGFDSQYAPTMFGGSPTVDKSSNDIEKVLLTALCISASITLLDYVIGKVKANKGKKKNANKQTVQTRQPQPAGTGIESGSGDTDR